MSSSPLLIVGLGNPGAEYAKTRHNAGWMVLDELASRSGVGSFKRKFSGEFARGTIEGREAVLLRPETFMNESGRSVQPAAAFFQVSPADVVVVHDELDLPLGDVRIKVGGGHAGHNGLRSIVQHLKVADFVRVRVGIGRPPEGFGGDVADYVLSSFRGEEWTTVPVVVGAAVEAVGKIASVGVDRAMLEVNSRPKGEKRSSGEGRGSPGSQESSSPSPTKDGPLPHKGSGGVEGRSLTAAPR